MSTSPGSTLLAIAFGLIELLDGPVDEPGAVPKFWLPEPAAAGLADGLLGQASRPERDAHRPQWAAARRRLVRRRVRRHPLATGLLLPRARMAEMGGVSRITPLIPGAVVPGLRVVGALSWLRRLTRCRTGRGLFCLVARLTSVVLMTGRPPRIELA